MSCIIRCAPARCLNFVGTAERSDWQVESWTERGTTEEALNDFKGWNADVETIIRNIEAPFKWALLGREPLAQWTKGRVTLLGDAAHPTLPMMAQGANMAIEDGVVLARSLAAHDDVAAALQGLRRRAPRPDQPPGARRQRQCRTLPQSRARQCRRRRALCRQRMAGGQGQAALRLGVRV